MKTAKILQIITVALYAAAFLLSIVCIFAQDLIKSFYYDSISEIREIRVIPYQIIFSRLFYLILALVYLLMLLRTPNRKQMIVITIVIGILYFVFSTVISSLTNLAFSLFQIKSMDTKTLGVYSNVSAAISRITGAFAAPAPYLMFLSLGFACGANCRISSEAD